MSFRHTGYCILKRTKKKDQVCLSIYDTGEITTSKLWNDFSSYIAIRRSIHDLIAKCNPNCIVMEVPDRSQSAKSAKMVGFVQAIAFEVRYELGGIPEIVFMEHLKNWSQSKRGDKKSKVKEKVCAYFSGYEEENNDNIIDAIGLCLAKCDELSLLEHEATRK